MSGARSTPDIEKARPVNFQLNVISLPPATGEFDLKEPCASGFQKFKVIGPRLHHFDPCLPERRTVVFVTVCIFDFVRKLHLDVLNPKNTAYLLGGSYGGTTEKTL